MSACVPALAPASFAFAESASIFADVSQSTTSKTVSSRLVNAGAAERPPGDNDAAVAGRPPDIRAFAAAAAASARSTMSSMRSTVARRARRSSGALISSVAKSAPCSASSGTVRFSVSRTSASLNRKQPRAVVYGSAVFSARSSVSTRYLKVGASERPSSRIAVEYS